MTGRDKDDAALERAALSFLGEAWPQRERPLMAARLHGAEARQWLARLAASGWRVPGWPVELGGRGLDLRQQRLVARVFEDYGAPRVVDLGAHLLGPILRNFGSDAQKAYHLPGIAKGSTIWCQGYSEPGAGSDLAALSTRAERAGDDFFVTGHKIWTTQAHYADWIFLLARTGTGARKQDGLSFMLCPMDADGLTVRPIRTLSGESEFCEVFFDGVCVPVDHVVGAPGQGWQVAMSLLGIERLSIGSPIQSRQAFRRMEAVFRQCPAPTPGQIARRAELACDLADLVTLYEDISGAELEDRKIGVEYSMLKVVASRLFHDIGALSVDLLEEQSGAFGSVGAFDGAPDIRFGYMLSLAATIYSGTNEVQLNLIARELLGSSRS